MKKMNEIEKINIYIEAVKDFLREKGIKENISFLEARSLIQRSPIGLPQMLFQSFWLIELWVTGLKKPFQNI